MVEATVTVCCKLSFLGYPARRKESENFNLAFNRPNLPLLWWSHGNSYPFRWNNWNKIIFCWIFTGGGRNGGFGG